MLRLKFLQHIHLLLLIASRFPQFFLALIIHHLLDHTSRFTVEITEFGILGGDLRGIDFWCGRDHVRPPFHLVDFVEVDRDFFLGLR